MKSRLLIVASLVVLAKLIFELAMVVSQCPIVIHAAELFARPQNPDQINQNHRLANGRLLQAVDTLTGEKEIEDYLNEIKDKGYTIERCVDGLKNVLTKQGFLDKRLACDISNKTTDTDSEPTVKAAPIKESSKRKHDTRPSAVWLFIRKIVVYLYHPNCGTALAITITLILVAIFANTMPEPWSSVAIMGASIVTISNNQISLQFNIWTFMTMILLAINLMFGKRTNTTDESPSSRHRDRSGKYIKVK